MSGKMKIATAVGFFLLWVGVSNKLQPINFGGSSNEEVAVSGSVDTSACAGVHWVKPGETLSNIAARYGHTVIALAQASNISNPNKISIGEKVCLPKSPAPKVAASSCSQQHVVAEGDTLEKIGRQYGTTAGVLASKNGLANPNYIIPGWKLCVSP